MKILFVNKFLYPNGGSETYIFELGRALQAMGHEVQYFGMEHPGRIVENSAGQYTKNMDFHGGKLSKLTYPFKIIYSREAAKKITKVLDDFKPDVVHFNNINFQLTPAVIEAVADYDIKHCVDTRMIYTAHDYQWVCPNHMMKRPADGSVCFMCEGARFGNCAKNRCIHGSRLRSILGSFEALFYKKRGTYGLIDTVIAPSEFMKEKLETEPELSGRCVMMHNFLVEDAACEEKDADHSEKYVLYFGRYAEEKGVKTLIDVCRRLPEVKFVFAGKGPLADLIKDVPNIKDVGFMDSSRMHELIRNSAFTVFPSEWYENCPFSVMESQQFGAPVIASDMGGTPELVMDGISGDLFKAGDAQDLMTKIKALWEDEDRLSRYREGCKQVKFDTVSEYCEKLLKLYK